MQMRCACGLGVLLFACSAAPGQPPQAGQSAPVPTLSVQSNLVVLDVVVTDEHGSVVPGLERKDFLIEQDGKPQTIRNFESWSERKPLPAEAPADSFGQPDWGNAPRNIFVLDGLTTPFQESIYAAGMLRKYLLAQPALLATPAMLMVVNDFGYRTLADYTRDRDKLIARLDARPPSIAGQFSMGSVSDTLTAQSIAVLQQIALSVAGVPAHKNIVWIGRGFPALDPSTLNDRSQASLAKAIRSTVTLLLEARVTVYKVDPMPTTTELTEVDPSATTDLGGAVPTVADEDPAANNFNLNQFAVQTGGRYFFGLNSLDRYMAQSVGEGGAFYTLTYVPPQASSDSYETIRVTMARAGLTARTRTGYYHQATPDPEPSSKELGFALGQAATGGMQFTGVGTHVAALSVDHGVATVTFTVENRTLSWTPRAEGGEVAEATAVLVALNAKHQLLGSAAYKLHPYLQSKDETLRIAGHLTVRDTIPASGKVAFMRVLLRDSSGRIGSADVPDAMLAAARSEPGGKAH